MAGAILESKEWYMCAYAPEGVPGPDHLKIRIATVAIDANSIPDGHLVVELLWVSIDPYLRSRMTGHVDGLYQPQFNLNEVITAFGIGRVIKSKDENFKEGDIVLNPFSPVAEYSVVPASPPLRNLDPAGGSVSLPDHLTFLGVPGFAAWVGIEVLGDPKPGSTVYISAAAGGVGMFAGQLAKLRGCKVVGSTGSDDKVRLVKDEFGYDEAFNYKKETDYDAALSKYCPNGIDVYLDNVGGKMLEAVLNHVNYHARIPVCGMISNYNTIWTEREGVRNLLNIVGKEVRIEGFILISYLDRFDDFARHMMGYAIEGKIKSRQKIYDGIGSVLESIQSLFSSSNDGKVIVKVK